jgi:hypothetical protein
MGFAPLFFAKKMPLRASRFTMPCAGGIPVNKAGLWQLGIRNER